MKFFGTYISVSAWVSPSLAQLQLVNIFQENQPYKVVRGHICVRPSNASVLRDFPRNTGVLRKCSVLTP